MVLLVWVLKSDLDPTMSIQNENLVKASTPINQNGSFWIVYQMNPCYIPKKVICSLFSKGTLKVENHGSALKSDPKRENSGSVFPFFPTLPSSIWRMTYIFGISIHYWFEQYQTFQEIFFDENRPVGDHRENVPRTYPWGSTGHFWSKKISWKVWYCSNQ